MEVQLDKLAEELGLDPAEMRLRHLVKPDTVTANWLKIGSMGLGPCIEKVVEGSGWKERFRKLPYGRGLGIACSSYITGAGLPIYWNDMPHSGVQIKCDRGGGVTVFCGSTDIGQGSDSILAYITAEVLGIDPKHIAIVTSDTDLTPVDLGSYSSRVTLMTGQACIQAAERIRARLARAAAAKLDVPADRLTFGEDRVFDTRDPERGMTFAEAVVLAETEEGTVGAVGSYKPPRSPGRYRGAGVGPSAAYSYSAAVAEVEVDPETGIVRVPKIWIGHDIGQCINPALVMGQVEGGVYMGLGEALMEEMAYRENRNVVHKWPSLLEYKSPTTWEMCDVITYLIEDPDANGPFGAKEAGQGPLLPVMPAVANAIYDAVGVRVDEVPMSPPKVLRAMQAKAKGQDPRFGPTKVPDVPWPEVTYVPTPAEGGDGARGRRPPDAPAPRVYRALPEYDQAGCCPENGQPGLGVRGRRDGSLPQHEAPAADAGLRGGRAPDPGPADAGSGCRRFAHHRRRGHASAADPRRAWSGTSGRCWPTRPARSRPRCSRTWGRWAGTCCSTPAAIITTRTTSGGRRSTSA